MGKRNNGAYFGSKGIRGFLGDFIDAYREE
jgi:hypothetical protein